MYSLIMFIPQLFFWLLAIIIFFAILFFHNKNVSISQNYENYVRKSYKENNFFDKFSNAYMIFYKFVMIILIVFLMGYVIGFILEYKRVQKFLKMSETLANYLQSDLFTWLGIIITIGIVLVTFRKEYYLTFTYREVLSSYHFIEKLQYYLITIIILKCIIPVKEMLFFKENNICMFALNIVCIVLCVWRYGSVFALFYNMLKIVFAQEQNELKILNKLYLKIDERICQKQEIPKKISDNAILMNVEYLLDQYIKNIPKIQFTNFKFFSVYEKYERFAYEKIRNFLRKILIIGEIIAGLITGIVTIICYSYFVQNFKKVIVIVVISISLCVLWDYILLYIGKFKGHSRIRQLLNRMFLGDYVIECEKNGEKIVISTDVLGPFEKNSDFVKAIINMIIFYKILEANNIKMKRVLKQLEGLYSLDYYKIQENQSEWYYIIMIYYSFLYYWGLSDKKRKKFVKKSYKMPWVSTLKNKEVIGLIKVLIRYTERRVKGDDALMEFDRFVSVFIRDKTNYKLKSSC